MSLISSAAAGLLRVEDVQSLIEEPLKAGSTAFAVSTIVGTDSPSVRFPIVKQDSSAGWTAELSPIDESQGVYDELVVTSKKLAALTKISNELANDSSPAAAAVIGDGLVRDLARKCDASFFGAQTTNSPTGLKDLIDVQHVDGASTLDTSFDWAAEAISLQERIGGTATAFVASYATVLRLMKVKEFTGASNSAEPLLASTDGNIGAPLGRNIFGVRLYSVPEGVVDDNVVWCLDQSRSFVTLRSGTTIEVDRSYAFNEDAVMLRAVLRAAWAWPFEQAVVKVSFGGS